MMMATAATMMTLGAMAQAPQAPAKEKANAPKKECTKTAKECSTKKECTKSDVKKEAKPAKEQKSEAKTKK